MHIYIFIYICRGFNIHTILHNIESQWISHFPPGSVSDGGPLHAAGSQPCQDFHLWWRRVQQCAPPSCAWDSSSYVEATGSQCDAVLLTVATCGRSRLWVFAEDPTHALPHKHGSGSLCSVRACTRNEKRSWAVDVQWPCAVLRGALRWCSWGIVKWSPCACIFSQGCNERQALCFALQPNVCLAGCRYLLFVFNCFHFSNVFSDLFRCIFFVCFLNFAWVFDCLV